MSILLETFSSQFPSWIVLGSTPQAILPDQSPDGWNEGKTTTAWHLRDRHLEKWNFQWNSLPKELEEHNYTLLGSPWKIPRSLASGPCGAVCVQVQRLGARWSLRAPRSNGGNIMAMFMGNIWEDEVPSGKLTKNYNYGKSPCLMGKSNISLAIFKSYVSLPEGKKKTHEILGCPVFGHNSSDREETPQKLVHVGW